MFELRCNFSKILRFTRYAVYFVKLQHRDFKNNPVKILSMGENYLRCILITSRFIKHNETDMHFLGVLIYALCRLSMSKQLLFLYKIPQNSYYRMVYDKTIFSVYISIITLFQKLWNFVAILTCTERYILYNTAQKLSLSELKNISTTIFMNDQLWNVFRIGIIFLI